MASPSKRPEKCGGSDEELRNAPIVPSESQLGIVKKRSQPCRVGSGFHWDSARRRPVVDGLVTARIQL